MSSRILFQRIREYVNSLRGEESADFVDPLRHERSRNDDKMWEVGNVLFASQIWPLSWNVSEKRVHAFKGLLLTQYRGDDLDNCYLPDGGVC